jgi:hypothetical protein
MFSLCVKASICKCFDFNLTVRDDTQSESAFFAMSTLRGICEDLIVLRYVKGMPSVDREALIAALIGHETATRIKLQDNFFAAIRPQQPVLRLNDADGQIASNEAAAQAVWNRHGWPNLKKGAMPQIRQIAEKQGLPVLSILYDYLYRLTSGGVHFNVQSLLRSGWGPSPKRFQFSTRHLQPYFSAYCATYGAFMFCLYFEFFGSILRPLPKVSATVAKIRENLLFTPRWPEMVTFEEMNLKVPEQGTTLRMIFSAFQAATRKRLVSRSVNYVDKSSTEHRLATNVFKALASASSSGKPKEARSPAE